MQFWDLVPIEFSKALEDWNSIYELKSQAEWERCRITSYFTIVSQSTKQISYKEFCEEFMPYDWDKQSTPIKYEDMSFLENFGKNFECVGSLGIENKKGL